MTADAAILDDPAVYERLDRSDMFGRLARAGGRLLAEWGRAAPHNARRTTQNPPSGVIIGGMGGSAIAGDYVVALARDVSSVPVAVVRDYTLPAWAGPETLVIACSHSGNTVETISLYQDAQSRRAPAGVIVSGGRLAELAARDGVPCWAIGPEGPPRVASAAILGVLLRVLGEAGCLAVSEAEVREAVAAYDRLAEAFAPDVPADRNEAKQLAAFLAGRVPFVLGAGHLAPAARRFKNQLAENAKQLGATDTMPEAAHNLVAGLALARRDGGRVALVVLESRRCGPPRLARQVDRFASRFEAAGVPVRMVGADGPSALAEQLAANAWADFTSAYLAILNGEDPTPIEEIDAMRETVPEFSVELLLVPLAETVGWREAE